MKFFKWYVSFKIKRMDLDDRIVYISYLLKETLEKASGEKRDDGTYINIFENKLECGYHAIQVNFDNKFDFKRKLSK